MYAPRLFAETDRERLFDLMEAYSFAMLIVPDEAGAVEIAHLPFLIDRAACGLRCHVARPNRIWKLAADGRPVTVVFSGPHAYISARWYEDPRQQVPTWNYAVVHAHGRARTPVPEGELRAIVRDLTAIHERGAPEPWSPEATEPGFIDEIVGGIVGLSITLERVEGKFKLSQNRSAEDQSRVRRELAERGDPADLDMLRWMR